MFAGLADTLADLHPFHRQAREEVADLVASRAILRFGDAPISSGPASSVDPFLSPEAAGAAEEVDQGPAIHLLLQGPAGSGKRSLAQAVKAALDGRMEVLLPEGDAPVQADHGVVVWISRDGRIPKGMPARTPRVRVRSLSSHEKKRLMALETERVASAFGLDPREFLAPEIQQILLRGGFPEAGVLGAVQRLQKLCRRRARSLMEGQVLPFDPAWAGAVLGPEALPLDPPQVRLPAGAVHSPVVSPLGGAIAQIEAFATPGRGVLSVTGAGPQAEVAACVARSRCLALAQHLRMQADSLRDLDWHIHVSGPEGPKDGTSMGWPALVAMASHLAGVAVDGRFAFTGELSLTGELRSVGFVEEKFLACEREGFSRLWIPGRNLPELAQLEPEALGSCEPTPVVQDLHALRTLGIVSTRT